MIGYIYSVCISIVYFLLKYILVVEQKKIK